MATREVDVHTLFQAAALVSQADMHSLRAAHDLVGLDVFQGLIVGIVFSEVPKHSRRSDTEQRLAEDMVGSILFAMSSNREAVSSAAG